MNLASIHQAPGAPGGVVLPPIAVSRGSAPIALTEPDAFIRTLSSATSDSREKAREAATSFVATAFLMPILATLHESPLQLDPPFAPGTGEQRFAPLLDQHLSDRIAKASNFALVDTIVDRIVRAEPPPGGEETLNVRA
jgi:hypothetical protein